MAEEIGLAVGRETDRSQVSHLEAVVEEAMCGPSDREIVIPEDLGSIGKFHRFEDANIDQIRQLVC